MGIRAAKFIQICTTMYTIVDFLTLHINKDKNCPLKRKSRFNLASRSENKIKNIPQHLLNMKVTLCDLQ